MKTAVLSVAVLLMLGSLAQAQFFGPVGPPGFGPRPGFLPYPAPPPFYPGPPPPIFGPRFGQGRGLAYLGSIGLLGLGSPLGALVGAAGLSGLLASDIVRL